MPVELLKAELPPAYEDAYLTEVVIAIFCSFSGALMWVGVAIWSFMALKHHANKNYKILSLCRAARLLW